MTDDEKEAMTTAARQYSMQFGRDSVWGKLEAKVIVAREQKRVSSAPSSPVITPEKASRTDNVEAEDLVKQISMELGSAHNNQPAVTTAR